MFLNHSDEQKIQRISKGIKEISLRLERLEKEIATFYKENKVTPEQLSHYLSKPEYFSQEQWETIQKMKHEMEQKLQIDLGKVEKKMKEPKKLVIQHNWLHVR